MTYPKIEVKMHLHHEQQRNMHLSAQYSQKKMI